MTSLHLTMKTVLRPAIPRNPTPVALHALGRFQQAVDLVSSLAKIDCNKRIRCRNALLNVMNWIVYALLYSISE